MAKPLISEGMALSLIHICLGHELFLRAEPAVVLRVALVIAVAFQFARLGGIAEVDVEYVVDALAHVGGVDGHGHFHAALHVARHQVGRGNVELLLGTGAEAVNARMLQKTAHDAEHAEDVYKRQAWRP